MADYYEEWFTTLSDETKAKIFDDVAKIIPEIEAKVTSGRVEISHTA
jgi:hypothetical protein